MKTLRKNPITVALFNNLPLKLIAFVLAVITWVLVVGEQKSEVRLTVPLELRNLPTDLEIIKSPREVEVTIRGFSSSVKRLTSRDFDVHIDLSSVVRGSNTFTVSPDEIAGPVGTTVTQVSPSALEVLLDATVLRVLPVEPIVRGKPVDGYVVGEVISIPNSVKVTGAQSLLKYVTKVETEAVILDDTNERISKKVKIKLPNSSFRIAKEDEIVEVTTEIVPEMISRFFENIPLLGEEGEERHVIFAPDSVTALISGPKLQLQQLASEDIPALIETKSLPDGQSTVQVKFTLPELVSVKVYYPKTIITSISRKNR